MSDEWSTNPVDKEEIFEEDVKYRIRESEYDALVQSRDQLRQSLQEVMDLIGEGVLVRNVTDDGSSDWAIRMLPLVSTLGRAQKLLESLRQQP